MCSRLLRAGRNVMQAQCRPSSPPQRRLQCTGNSPSRRQVHLYRPLFPTTRAWHTRPDHPPPINVWSTVIDWCSVLNSNYRVALVLYKHVRLTKLPLCCSLCGQPGVSAGYPAATATASNGCAEPDVRRAVTSAEGAAPRRRQPPDLPRWGPRRPSLHTAQAALAGRRLPGFQPPAAARAPAAEAVAAEGRATGRGLP